MNAEKISSGLKYIITGYGTRKMLASTFLTIVALNDLEDENIIPATLYDDINVKETKKFLVETFFDLKNIMKSENEKVYVTLNKILSMRDALVEMAYSAFSYDFACETIYKIVSKYYMLSIVKKDTDPELKDLYANDSVFMKAIENSMEFINSEKDATMKELKKAIVISRFPLNMTDNEYDEYVRKSLVSAMENRGEKVINELVKSFQYKIAPFHTDFYGEHFKYLKERADVFFKEDYSTYDIDDLEDTLSELDKYRLDTDNLIYCLEILLEGLSYLTIILTFGSNLENIFGGNLTHKDLYFAFKENFLTDNYEIMKEEIMERLEGELEDILDECNNMESSIRKNLSQLDFEELDEENKKYIDIFNVINSVYGETLINLCFPVSSGQPITDTQADKNYIIKKTDLFIDFYNDALSQININSRNNAKLSFLETIPCYMEKNDFIEYLENSFNKIDNPIEKIIVLDAVNDLIKN